MPLAPLLTNEEKAAILVHDSHGLNKTEISNEMGRSRDAIARFLANPHPNSQKKWKPRNTKLTPAAVRLIVREASKTKKSASEIKHDLDINVSVRRVQQVLNESGTLRYMQAPRAPYMKEHHKKDTVLFAREMLDWNHPDWRYVVFTDEKKFNLDGPDGLDCYWHDLRTTPDVFSKRQQGGASVMVWGALSFFGLCELWGVEGNQDSKKYCQMLEEHCLPWAAETLGEDWTLMHDGASTHRSNYTKAWLNGKNVVTLDWPAKSPDLNIIENVWGLMARKVYHYGRHFNNVDELTEKIVEVWDDLAVSYIQSLYHWIPKRLLSVIDRKAATTKY